MATAEDGSERDERALRGAERRRDNSLIAWKAALDDATEFLDYYLESTITFPLLVHAKGKLETLRIASVQYEHDSNSLLEVLPDLGTLTEEDEFLRSNLVKSQNISRQLSSFLEEWETDLTADRVLLANPEARSPVEMHTPSRRRRSVANNAAEMITPSNRVLPRSFSQPNSRSCSSVCLDTPMRRRLQVTRPATTSRDITVQTPLSKRRVSRGTHPDVTKSLSDPLPHPLKEKVKVEVDPSKFVQKILTPEGGADQSSIRESQIRSPPRPLRNPNANSGGTNLSSNQNRQLPPAPKSEPELSAGKHSPSCEDCKAAKNKLVIMKLKYKVAIDFVRYPSEKSDRDGIKRQLNRLLEELEPLIDEELYDLANEAHELVSDVTIRFAEYDARTAAETTVLNDTRSVASHKTTVKFKPIAIPKFDNTLRGYAEFKSKFTCLVSTHMDEELALLRLKEESLAPKSVAYQLCRGKTSLAEAWKALDGYYGRASVVKDAVLKDLHDLKVVKTQSDSKGLRELLAAIVSAKEDLKRANMLHALGESAFSTLMTKIPYQLRNKIDDKIFDRNSTVDEQVSIFVEVVERHTMIQEAHELRTLAHGSSPPKDKDKDKIAKGRPGKSDKSEASLHLQKFDGQSHPSGKRPPKPAEKGKKPSGSGGKSDNSGIKPRYCAFHPDGISHSTLYCPNIVNMSSSELENKICAKKLCHLCFGSHATVDCRSARSCPEANCPNPKGHNRLLHPTTSTSRTNSRDDNSQSQCPKPNRKPRVQTSSEPPSENAEKAKPSPAQSSASQATLTSADFLAQKPVNDSERDAFNSQLGYNTLRPSHIAYLKSESGELFPIKIMYDTGGDLTQVVNSAVKRSVVKPINSLSNLRISAAGDHSPKDWGRADLYELPVYDALGDCVLFLRCLSVDNIGYTKSANMETVSQLFEHKGHDISDILQPASGSIDLLIGCNYANHQPQPIDTIDTVTLAECKFGKLLYGSHISFPPESNSAPETSSYIVSLCTDHIQLLDFEVSPACSSVISPAGYIKCCPCSYIATTSMLTKSERDFFDQMVAIDTELGCAKCGKCLVDSQVEKDAQMAMYRECLTYLPEKQKFMTKMPWIRDFQILPDNKDAALKRLYALTKSYSKDEHMRKWYVSEFEKLIENGILVEVSNEEAAKWAMEGNKVWYVAHFPVLNESSSSTPLRVVFDPTLKYKGMLIGTLWEKPPNLIPAIPDLLLRFREHYVPVSCDVSKAYWSLFLELPESHLHRVVWNRLDPNESTRVYRMKRNSWGMSPAGSLCSIAMLITAEMHRSDYPHVYDFIKSNLYVDDGAFSVKDVETAVKLAKDTCTVMATGGFNLKHFIIGGVPYNSDCDNVSLDLPKQVRFANHVERILGILWDPKEDTINFPCRVNFTKRSKGARSGPDTLEENYDAEFPQILTLRQFTSVVYTHYDPLGISTPVSIIMRHEMGLLHLLGGGWDDPIPREDSSQENQPTTYDRCKVILKYFYGLAKVSFTRCLRPPDTRDSDPVLVVFSDMSLLACGTVVYYNWQTPAGDRVSRLVGAKAKPCPKKPPLLTVPRGECLAAQMAVILADSICKSSIYQIKRRLFLVDSTIVLSQIAANDPTRFNTWVSGKVSEIQRLADPTEFYHIETALNIADDATRGLDPSMIGPESRWQCGERFMVKPVEEWPIKPCLEVASVIGSSKDLDIQMEVRSRDPRMTLNRGSSSLAFMSFTDYDLTVYSTIIRLLFSLDIRDVDENEPWIRAQRRIARLVHLLEHFASILASRKSIPIQTLCSTFQKLRPSEASRWISQHDQFCPTPVEMKTAAFYLVARAQKELSKKQLTSMRALSPQLGADGLWRVHGRTSTVQQPPVIIPSGTLAKIILCHSHVPTHSGASTTLANSRRHFWIIKGATLANSLVAKCSRCLALRKKPYQLPMAPLKEAQCRRSQVFDVVAIDLCGPYFTKSDRQRSTRQSSSVAGKVWILVIVCAASRAVHLELCDGYSTVDVLLALKAFNCVRGVPSKIFADKGSQLVGASKVVKLWDTVNVAKLKNALCTTTEFEFVPSGAHNFVGMSERLVGSVKTTMNAIYHSDHPRLTKLQFCRMLLSIAEIVNSRPLAIRSNRASKLEESIICPNDLLLGRSTSSVSPATDPLSENPRKYLDLIRQRESFLNAFWTKWYRVVFSSLMPRGKWLMSGQPVSVHDLVLIRDTNPIRGSWSWGEVVETYASVDQTRRKALVRYKSLSNKQDGSRNLRRSKSKLVIKSVRDLCPIMRVHDRDDL